MDRISNATKIKAWGILKKKNIKGVFNYFWLDNLDLQYMRLSIWRRNTLFVMSDKDAIDICEKQKFGIHKSPMHLYNLRRVLRNINLLNLTENC